MAQTATIHTFGIDLAHIDRGVFERLDLKVARHPSETTEYMLARVLAYCCEFREGIAMTEGLSSGDEPAVLVKDLTGRITAWIEVGMPDANRLHRAAKLAARVAVYTHRDIRQLLAQLAGQKIHRGGEIPIYALDRGRLEELAAVVDRRADAAISISAGDIYVTLGSRTVTVPIVEHHATPAG